ncbi:MAG: VOC family protein [Halanaerobiaceae bacterium]|jgi:2-dehydro-3-deoxyphosphogluconate aldolase/(4S)-4-hydroxy-2-oxoglutarate aldolase|nr:VOC family protein [Halanaerobiaceae bacterium]
MSTGFEDLGFEAVHIGVNCEDDLEAGKTAEFFAKFFAFPLKEGNSSIFASPFIEIMKGDGRGKHGHIAIGTSDLLKAQKYIEEQGLVFDPESVKYNSEGEPILIYLKEEIAGFAVHLLQK